MANDQTYNNGFGSDGGQITTLSDIQSTGLILPSPQDQFINIRQGGKIQRLFETGNNANLLYSINRPDDLYFSDFLSNRFDYKNPIQGQQNRVPNTVFRASLQDSSLVRKFIGSNTGRIFLTKQFILQGFQSFDETKVYNPLSARISAFRRASFGLIGRPTRHIDTSNLVSGLIGGAGLGSAVGAISGLFGGGQSQPSPPRSSVASEASKPGGFLGISLASFTSLLGGGDLTNDVMPPNARDGVKGLLRGGTATTAYYKPRYARLANESQGFLSKIGSALTNATLIGGILPPKQPIDAKYRADEETYDLYLKSGGLFDPNFEKSGAGGILAGIKKIFGFGDKISYSLSVSQRFANSTTNVNPVRLRIEPNKNKNKNKNNDKKQDLVSENRIAYKSIDSNDIFYKDLPKNSLNYNDYFGYRVNEQTEYSDQLLNYNEYNDNSKQFKRTHSDSEDLIVKSILETYNKSITNILGQTSEKYTSDNIQDSYPLQYSRFNSDGVGFDQLKDVKSWRNKNGSDGSSYKEKIALNDENSLYPSIESRKIRPTNDVDYVNSLEILNEGDFQSTYRESSYGPDIINFYFYDIINEKYIPFNATIKGLTETNSSTWEDIEYLGRADKLYSYKGFNRTLSFNFKCVAHSIKELIPMWKRISYLTSFVRPANYTNNQIGFIIPPLVNLTVGDFYKDQPCIIESCTPSIDEGTLWETLPMDLNKDWTYGLNDMIKYSESTEKYGQLPRECDISISTKIIEKQVTRVGNPLWANDSLLQPA